MQFRSLIQRTLVKVEMYSRSAEELLIGTAAHESHLGTYLRQLGGPARGFFQMEPETERDIWKNYLRYRPGIADTVEAVTSVCTPSSWALESNLAYQIVMARLQYRRSPEPLPPIDNVSAMAKYWDEHYNCNPNKGLPKQFIQDYYRFVL